MAVQVAGEPPVGLAHQDHQGGDEDEPDDRRDQGGAGDDPSGEVERAFDRTDRTI
ncbi:hypothetical protein [Actinomadura sp. B10D3]|uniref:hypothetical protein n=1 Tax=Actinomadura sp. B10D3 TaxID=3153557 RepID=UPI00325DE152